MEMLKTKTTIRSLSLVSLLTLVALAAPSTSSASFEIVPGSLEIETLNSEGNPDTRAGAHPDHMLVKYKLNFEGTAMKDLLLEFGPGLTGTPLATPVCSRAVFEDEECPADTQVGAFTMQFGHGTPERLPLFNVGPTSSDIAALGFVPLWQSEFGMFLRPTDYGLSMGASYMPEVPSPKGQVELWGIPADHVAAPERAAFLTSPTQCGPLEVVMEARSWEPGAPWVRETSQTAPFTECENLSFEPSLGMQLDEPSADSPTGAEVDLNVVPHNGPDEPVSASLKETTIHFPHGVAVSPGSVEGMVLCSDAQFGLGTASPVKCPARSRVGTVEVVTPQLNEPLTGPVFLGEELPGERFRLFIDGTAPGVPFKALGKLLTDPQTGDLSAVLSGLPQVSLSQIRLILDNGSKPLLASPLSCGPVSAQARFAPYGPQEPVESSAVVNVKSRPGVNCGEPLPFSPGLTAGSTQRSGAGNPTAFSFTLTRRDGEQLAKRFSVALPEGLNANLNTVDLCGDAAAEAIACPESSRIGTAVAEVGSGASPALVRGKVYLTGPYRGAPFGLSTVFNATIGPYHLGSLNLRGMLRIDPHTGQHSLEVDPLPTVFEGLALRFRTVGIDLDRPGFAINPTSCAPTQVHAEVRSVDGRAVSIANPFYLGGCDTLGFKPGFSLSVKEGRSHGAAKPVLSFGVTGHRKDANFSQFQVKFPRLLAFHSGTVKAICPRDDAIEGICPAASRVGNAFAKSPLVREPLRGPVYLIQPKGHGIPGFMISLVGGGVPLQLFGESSRQGGRVTTKMVELPDIPMSTFDIHLNGGKDGLFSLRSSPCQIGGRALTSPVGLQAHDGAHREMQAQLKASCGSRASAG